MPFFESDSGSLHDYLKRHTTEAGWWSNFVKYAVSLLKVYYGDPGTYNLPPEPEVPTIYLRKGWTSAAIASGLMLAATVFAFLGGRRA